MADGNFTASVSVTVDATNRTKGVIVKRSDTGEFLTEVPAGQTGSASYTVADVISHPVLEFDRGQ
jgi:hypothetical protein